MTTEYNYEKERQEAIAAGRNLLNTLRMAEKELNSAGNWGIVDLLGGGLLTDLFKHGKMNNAQRYLEDARRQMQTFSRELNDISAYVEIDFNKADFLSFADYFFDGLIADWLVQDRINNAKKQVHQAIDKVESILRSL